jgi:hypothetical protein
VCPFMFSRWSRDDGPQRSCSNIVPWLVLLITGGFAGYTVVAVLVETLKLIRKSLDAVVFVGAIGLDFVDHTFVCDIVIGGIRGRSRIGMRLLESQKIKELESLLLLL